MHEPDIEFYEAAAPPALVAAPRRSRRPRPPRAVVAGLLGAISIAIFVLTPFRRLYGVRLSDDGTGHPATTWFDGWGRGDGSGSSGVRWVVGIYLATALVLVALVLATIGPRWLGRSARRLAAALALAGSGVLLGILVAQWLTIASLRSTAGPEIATSPLPLVPASLVPAALDPSGGTTYSSTVSIAYAQSGSHVVVAAGIWLPLVGVLLALAALQTAVGRRPTASTSTAPLGSAPPSAATDPRANTGSRDDDDTN